jgi:ferritin-like metal-binding protein YciE
VAYPFTKEAIMSSTDIRSLFITGLRDAHAMENQALAIMRPQLSRIENYPDVRRQLETHIRETEGQIIRLEAILETLGEDKSTLKDAALSIAGGLAALGHTVAPDEILKNSFANNAFENFEIAAYKSLITIAREIGSEAVDALQLNLDEEIAMAAWLDANIGTVTDQYVGLRAAGEHAKK